ncbi:FtsX-like permease family protein [Bacteroidia bacterium]|nr:FtsX-like permease family protein [Bacteroidia bacterium]MDB9882688.1 FtsX-like permease family protein [Bacteroidia bacterium]
MRFPLFIAYRYLFSKKKVNAINIITGIAMLGFGVGAFAMIVVLSTFNGFENLVEGMINNYDPEIRITAKAKKTFVYTSELESKISVIEGVIRVSEVLEEKVVVKYDEHQEIGKIKGVSENYNTGKFDSLIVIGNFNLGDSSRYFGVFGGGLSGKLNLFPGTTEPVTVFVPRRDVKYNSLNPMASLSTQYLRASGIFLVKEEVDDEVFITSLEFAQKLLSYPGQITALELGLQSEMNIDDAREKLKEVLGADYEVKTRKELNELIYKIFSSEKWFTFAILALVLFISSFNIFGSLIMLVLDKKKDIGILKSMGTEDGIIRKVFLWQGSYIAIVGGGIGIVLACILVLSQEHFGWLTIENAIVDEYPVELLLRDVLLTFSTVSILGYLISLYPASRAAKTEISKIN